ncbi:MAG: 30S ribosomal protein S17 [Candidatus Schekmanbacteria bacterium]|nr:30S ribosomal protein S17 [Candidatus Schekmanbacteria bacterium]
MKVNKELVGTVVSNRMDKTVVVAVERLVRHPKYNKIYRRRVKFKVHDEKNECKLGDKVRIIETRPISKDKRSIVKEIITRAER